MITHAKFKVPGHINGTGKYIDCFPDLKGPNGVVQSKHRSLTGVGSTISKPGYKGWVFEAP